MEMCLSQRLHIVLSKCLYILYHNDYLKNNSSLGVGQRSRGPLVLKTTQVGLNAQMKSHKGTSSSLLKERNSNPRAPVRHVENKGGRTVEENKEETKAKEMQRQRYVIVEPQLSSSSTPLFVRALDGEGLFGRGVAKFV